MTKKSQNKIPSIEVLYAMYDDHQTHKTGSLYSWQDIASYAISLINFNIPVDESILSDLIDTSAISPDTKKALKNYQEQQKQTKASQDGLYSALRNHTNLENMFYVVEWNSKDECSFSKNPSNSMLPIFNNSLEVLTQLKKLNNTEDISFIIVYAIPNEHRDEMTKLFKHDWFWDLSDVQDFSTSDIAFIGPHPDKTNPYINFDNMIPHQDLLKTIKTLPNKELSL